MNTTISNKIKIASLIAIACTMLGKILGLLREMKIAEALGASASSDAYNVAYLLVLLHSERRTKIWEPVRS